MQKLFIYTVLLFCLACKNKKEQAQTTQVEQIVANAVSETIVTLTDAQLKNTKIIIGKAETKGISNVLKVSGKIDVPPQNLVSISAPTGGYLTSTNLLPGMHVSKGQTLATLQDQQLIDLQQQYLNSKVQLELLHKDYQRQRELNISQASSNKVLQQAKASYDAEYIQLKTSEKKLQMIGINPNSISANNMTKSVNVYSPISGFVSSVNVNIGKYVSPNEILFELVNPNDIHLNLQIFEKDVSKLFIGQKLIAYTPSKPTEKHFCSIILISKDVNANKTIDVHCHFDNYDKTLLPGMYLTSEIETESKTSLAVPEDAIVNFENRNYIFISKPNNTFQLTEVVIGDSENGFVHISPFQNVDFTNTDIVLQDAYTLLMTMKNVEE